MNFTHSRPIGVIGVLLRAKQNDDIGSVKGILNKLRDEAGFYMTDSFLKDILSAVGELQEVLNKTTFIT